MDSPHPIVELREVVKIYSTEAGEFPALRGVSLSVNAGEFLGIVGKSGAGKSTLLNMINGVDRLTSGNVLVRSNSDEVVVHRLDENQLALWRGRTMGVVYQSFQLLPMLTLIENIVLPMDLCGTYKKRESRERALDLLRLVEVEDHANKLPSQISGGQQQRVAIARALANDPPILVADEPTGNLDSATAEAVIRLFDALVGAGKTIVMVTHDREIAAHARRTVHMVDGHLLDGMLPDEPTAAVPGAPGDLAADQREPARA